ncbi:MAG: adenylosuccinate synthetase, partial [Lentisphaerae bacterium]|nr:adenylosuccinate synthetase [Lentisphaerota bacterium]
WFDAVVGKYAAMINGADYWAMTKLDVLDSLDTLKICVGYECDGEVRDTLPARIQDLQRYQPVYEEMPGWKTPTTGATGLGELPQKARDYVDRLCELTGVELGILSVGPGRESTIRVAL